MDKLTIIVAIAALGLGGWAAWSQCELEGRMDGIEQGVKDTQGSIDELNAQLATALATHPKPEDLLSAEGGAVVPVSADGTPSGEAGLASRRSMSAIERLEALEKRVAEQNKFIDDLKETTESPSTSGSLPMPPRFASNFIHNMDSAAKSLELTERQKADMQDLVDQGKRELEELRTTRNDDGDTWKEVAKPKMRKLGEGEGGISISMPDFGKVQKFKKSKVPGTNETFGQAEKRIRENTFGQIRNLFDPKQAKKWDRAHKSPLLGAGGSDGAVAISAFSFESEGK